MMVIVMLLFYHTHSFTRFLPPQQAIPPSSHPYDEYSLEWNDEYSLEWNEINVEYLYQYLPLPCYGDVQYGDDVEIQ